MPKKKGLPKDILIAVLRTLDEAKSTDPDNRIKNTILTLLEKNIKNHGKNGLEKLRETVVKLVEGNQVGMLDLSDDLLLASDLLILLQNLEADQRQLIKQWVLAIIEELIKIWKTYRPGIL